MSIAGDVLKTIQDHPVKEWSAIGYDVGYAMDLKGNRVTFPPCRVVRERRNSKGRVTYMLGDYSDGSHIVYKWSETNGPRVTAVTAGPGVALSKEFGTHQQTRGT